MISQKANKKEEPEYCTLLALKTEFGLTGTLIRELGEPDLLKPNPRYKKSSPMKLYLASRVRQWIVEHQNEIISSERRKQSAEKALATKRESARLCIAEYVKKLEMRPIKSRKSIEREAQKFFFQMYRDFNGKITEKGLCSFLRHNYTNYEEILDEVKGKVGAAELYQNVKVYLCCCIIDNYDLDVDPLYAAFGQEAIYNEVPDRFLLPDSIDLKDVVAGMLGISSSLVLSEAKASQDEDFPVLHRKSGAS